MVKYSFKWRLWQIVWDFISVLRFSFICSWRTNWVLCVGSFWKIRYWWAIKYRIRVLYFFHWCFSCHIKHVCCPCTNHNCTFWSIFRQYFLTVRLNGQVANRTSIFDEINRVNNGISFIFFSLLERFTIFDSILKSFPFLLMFS